MVTIVKKLGGSLAVVIPRSLAREAGLAEGTPLELSATAAGLVLRKQGRRPRRSMTEIIAQIDPAGYRRHNRVMSDDGPAGKEIW